MLLWLMNQILRRKPAMLAPGDRAPDFALLDQEQRLVRLADLAGRRFLIWFYPKAGTSG